MDYRPPFTVILYAQVNWDSEQECFESFSQEFSSFYAVQYDPFLIDTIAKSPEEDLPSNEDDQVCSFIVGACRLNFAV